MCQLHEPLKILSSWDMVSLINIETNYFTQPEHVIRLILIDNGKKILESLVMLAWVYNKFWVNRKNFKTSQTMQGKTVLITGANAGIGYETAKDLLQRGDFQNNSDSSSTTDFYLGARVILVCRSAERGEKALRQLREITHCDETMVRLMLCDLSSYQSVRDFAAQYNEEEQRLDVLICNAGLVSAPEKVTKDGFDTVIQSNYLSHFLLTNLLLDKLKACRPSRIINVSSGSHHCNYVFVSRSI